MVNKTLSDILYLEVIILDTTWKIFLLQNKVNVKFAPARFLMRTAYLIKPEGKDCFLHETTLLH